MKKIIITGLIIITYVTNFAQNNFIKIAEVPHTSVKNQKRAGTCWSFATVSFLEAETLKKTGKELDFSENYIVYYAYINKARQYLYKQGHHQFDQGGQAHDVINVIKKYGIVTEKAFPYRLSDHTEMYKKLKKYLDRLLRLDSLPENWLTGYTDILNEYLGTPPIKFKYKNKKYTPKEFAAKVMQFDPDQYIELSSFSSHPYYQQFVLEVADNWSCSLYYNIPFKDLSEIMQFALKNGYSIDWDGDVSEKTFNPQNGEATISGKITDIETQHQQDYDRLLTTDDHLMHIVGIYKDQKGNIFYKTKNSWGEYGPYKGYIYMSEPYTLLKNIAIMVNINAIPDEIKTKLNLK